MSLLRLQLVWIFQNRQGLSFLDLIEKEACGSRSSSLLGLRFSLQMGGYVLRKVSNTIKGDVVCDTYLITRLRGARVKFKTEQDLHGGHQMKDQKEHGMEKSASNPND